MNRITKVTVVGLVIVALCAGAFTVGWRQAASYGLSGQTVLPAVWMHSIRVGDTNRAYRRMDATIDINALSAVQLREKLWMLPRARANLDKVILRVAEYREQYPRDLTDPLYIGIYPHAPFSTTNAMSQQFKQNSDWFWNTVNDIRSQQ